MKNKIKGCRNCEYGGTILCSNPEPKIVEVVRDENSLALYITCDKWTVPTPEHPW